MSDKWCDEHNLPCPCGCWSGGFENGEIVKNVCLINRPLCPECGGSGTLLPLDDPRVVNVSLFTCPTCQGTGVKG